MMLQTFAIDQAPQFQAPIFGAAMAEGLRPPPFFTLSGWADEYAHLSAESAATSGKWHSYPYQIGIMDAFTNPRLEQITIIKSTRVGYTKIINHAVAYHIHYDPCPQMVVQPTVEDSQGYSKEEIGPMLRDTPILTGLVSEPRSRDSGNTILRKIYPGGFLVLVGANSARGFRRITVRNVYFDEVDAYPPTAGQEGDQIKLGSRRTDTFWNRKIIIGGTPTVKGFSRVEFYFEKSDQRRFYVDCPHCGNSDYFRFKNLKWPKDNPERAHFICQNCQKEIDEKFKYQMIESGEWRAAKEMSNHAGFHIWAAYSYAPKTTWAHIAREFLEVKSNPDLLKTFVNTVLGETWEEKGEGIDSTTIEKRAEDYGLDLANEILIITIGVDVQADRLEGEIVGWGAGLESWSIDYFRIPGDPHFVETWQNLDKVLGKAYKRADGVKLKYHTAFIDSGYATQEVYKFCYPRQSRRVYATKGQPKPGNQIVALSKKRYKRRGLKLFNIATIGAKDKIFAYLQIKKPGPGFCHFPDRYGQDYFDMLTAEKKYPKKVKGVTTYFYRKFRPRNEALDCRVLALAALEKADPKWAALAKRLAKKALANQEQNQTDKQKEQIPERNIFIANRRRPPARRRPGGFVHGWKQ
jgi:phage terminase large subunit GpA-like protein